MRRLLAVVCALGALAVGVSPAGAGPSRALVIKPGIAHLTASLHVKTPQAPTPKGSQVTIPILNLGIPLSYSGGPVQQNGTTTYAIFWVPGATGVSPGYVNLINRYLQDIGGSSLYGVASQYYQRVSGQQLRIVNQSQFGDFFWDTALPYPSSTLQDSDIQAEVLRAVQFNGWPGGIGSQFFVFTARGENSCIKGQCSFTTYCGYHSSFSAYGTDYFYANQPYAATDPSGCGTPSNPNRDDADSTINILSHEQMEMLTDPKANAWSDLLGSEIGDKCNFNFGNADSDGANVTLGNGDRYIVQQEWSNARGRCSLSG